MNCQQIRAAIDASSLREPFGENASGHIAGCRPCRDYAAQMTALFALVRDVPQVQVPNDFDFRLRARIAQSKSTSDAQRGTGFFSEFWKLSFSWGQAASALAAVALVVTLSTAYLVRDDNPAPVEPTEIAVNVDPTPVASVTPGPGTADAVRKSEISEPPPPVVPRPIRSDAGLVRSVSTASAKTERPAGVLQPPAVTERNGGRNDLVATRQIIIRNSGRSQRVSVRDVSYGVQPTVLAVEHTPRPVQAVF